MLGGTYMYIGQHERTLERVLAQVARGDDTHTCRRTGMVIALAVTGHRDQAMAAADALIEAAEASHNPWSISYAWPGVSRVEGRMLNAVSRLCDAPAGSAGQTRGRIR
jgi:hypothetical protein